MVFASKPLTSPMMSMTSVSPRPLLRVPGDFVKASDIAPPHNADMYVVVSAWRVGRRSSCLSSLGAAPLGAAPLGDSAVVMAPSTMSPITSTTPGVRVGLRGRTFLLRTLAPLTSDWIVAALYTMNEALETVVRVPSSARGAKRSDRELHVKITCWSNPRASTGERSDREPHVKITCWSNPLSFLAHSLVAVSPLRPSHVLTNRNFLGDVL